MFWPERVEVSEWLKLGRTPAPVFFCRGEEEGEEEGDEEGEEEESEEDSEEDRTEPRSETRSETRSEPLLLIWGEEAGASGARIPERRGKERGKEAGGGAEEGGGVGRWRRG